jgi:multidrug efflux pump subunit AcrA (membrane-fusion protein)
MAKSNHSTADRKPSVTKRMIIMLALAAVLFGGVFGFQWFMGVKMNEFFDEMPTPPATVSAAAVLRDTWPREIRAVGTFKATNGVELTTELGGIVRAIEFENGSYVEAGEILARLDVSTDEAELAALEAARDLAESEVERLRRLRAQRSVSESELDQAESRFRQAVAEVEAQRARIEQKTLRAPFDGYLGIRRVDLGEYIAPGTPIVPLRARADLPRLHPAGTPSAAHRSRRRGQRRDRRLARRALPRADYLGRALDRGANAQLPGPGHLRQRRHAPATRHVRQRRRALGRAARGADGSADGGQLQPVWRFGLRHRRRR